MYAESDSRGRSPLVALFLLTGALLAGPAACNRPPGPNVVATVNGKPLYRADLDKMYQASLNGNQQKPSPQEADIQRLNVLHQMIINEILQQQAAKLNLVASDEDVNSQLTEIKTPYTEEEFNQHLKDLGITLDDFKKQIRENLTDKKLLNREIESKINITDAEISDYYMSHKADFDLIEPHFHIAWIFVTGASAQQTSNLQDNKAVGDADARKKIETLHNRLDSGQDFSSVAMQFSEDPNTSSSGGDLGIVPESQLKAYPDMFNAITKLRPDQYSGVLPAYRGEGPDRHQIGYAIYKLIALEPAGQRELKDPRVQQTIHDLLHERKRQLLQYAYYETLNDAAKVQNYYADQVLKQGAP